MTPHAHFVNLHQPTHSVYFVFVLQAGWSALGAESGTKFDDIDLTEGDWADYDEKVYTSWCWKYQSFSGLCQSEVSHC
jgi:Eukaryotic protein of unknown function (DUF866)